MKTYQIDSWNRINSFQYHIGFSLIKILAKFFKFNIQIGDFHYEYGKIPKNEKYLHN